MELSQGQIIQKPKMQELSSLFITHLSQCDSCTCKVSRIYSIRFRSYGPDTVYYMKLSQGEIIQKAKMQEFSSLFMTHRLNVMHAPVKFYQYIPYGLGVMARTLLTIWNLVKGKYSKKTKMQEFSSLFMTHRPSVMHAPVKLHEYIPYGLGVMAQMQSGTYILTEGQR